MTRAENKEVGNGEKGSQNMCDVIYERPLNVRQLVEMWSEKTFAMKQILCCSSSLENLNDKLSFYDSITMLCCYLCTSKGNV